MLDRIKDLVGDNSEKDKMAQHIAGELSKAMGKEVEVGNTGYTDGISVFDRDEENIGQ